MSDLLDTALERAQSWTPARRREAAELLLALDDVERDPLDDDDETLAVIDRALAQVERRDLADPARL